MSSIYSDRVQETTETEGTGVLELLGTPDGSFFSFIDAFGDNGVCKYTIIDSENGDCEIGIGTVNLPVGTGGDPNTLSRDYVIRSTNGDALVDFGAGTKTVICSLPSRQARLLESPIQLPGRLTGASGTPVPTSDQTGVSTLYYALYPPRGNLLSLYKNGVWRPYPISEIQGAVPSSVFRIYDVYAYDNDYDDSGELDFEFVAWDSGGQTTASVSGATNATPIVVTTSSSHGFSTGNLVGCNSFGGNTAPNGKMWSITVLSSTTFQLDGSVGNGAYTSGGTVYLIPTARTTNYTTQDGMLVQSGATDRLLLGSIMTGATSGQTEDSESARLIINAHNRIFRKLKCVETTDSWTYSTNTNRPSNNNTTLGQNRLMWLCSIAEETIEFFNCQSYLRGSAVNQVGALVGIGIDSTSVNSADINGGLSDTNGNTAVGKYDGIPSIGAHYAQRLEGVAGASATTTWYGDNGWTTLKSGMVGRVPV